MNGMDTLQEWIGNSETAECDVTAEPADILSATFDRDDAPRPGVQQRARQAARTGADFEHRHTVKRLGGARYSGAQIGIEKEMLAERFARFQAMAGYRFGETVELVVGAGRTGARHEIRQRRCV